MGVSSGGCGSGRMTQSDTKVSYRRNFFLYRESYEKSVMSVTGPYSMTKEKGIAYEHGTYRGRMQIFYKAV